MRDVEQRLQARSLGSAAIAFAAIVFALLVCLAACSGASSQAASSRAPETDSQLASSRAAEPGDSAEAYTSPSAGTVSKSADATGDPAESPSSDASSTAGASGTSGAVPEDQGKQRYEEGVLLVQLAPGATGEQVASEIEGATIADEFDDYVKLSLPAGMTVEEAAEALEASEHVESAQPNFIYELQDSKAASLSADLARQSAQALQPLSASALAGLSAQADAATNDPYLPGQWALDFMNVERAWDTARADGSVAGSKKVTVAVIDASFQASHPDLKGNVVSCYNAVTKSTAASSMGYSAGDTHGTHVVGIVSAKANNGIGVAGVSYNAQLALVRVFDSDGNATTEYLVRGFKHIIAKADSLNIRVASMSVGAKRGDSPASAALATSDTAVLRAIDAAWDAGIVTVCSGGNEGDSSYNYPSDYEKVVSVMNLMPDSMGGSYVSGMDVIRANGMVAQKSGALDSFMMTWPDSSYNAAGTHLKDISAPGSTLLSTWTRSRYGYESGTSMAAPAVAGVLALAFSVKPELTPAQATSLLYSTATDVRYSSGGEKAGKGWDRYTGYGAPNAARMVSASHSYYLSGASSLLKGSKRKYVVKGTPSQRWKWASSDKSVATVNANGTVSAKGPGTAIITATSAANSAYKAVQTVSVYDPVLVGDATVKVGTTNYYDLVCQEITAWKFSSSNTNVATVGSTSGKLRAKKAGSVTITATSSANPSVKVKKKVRVVVGYLGDAKARLSKTACSYNGKARKPGTAVKLGGKTLRRGVDYTVTYAKNTKPGTAKVTIKGKGAYAGKKVLKFKIARRSVAKATVKLSKTRYRYNGKTCKPNVAVKVGSLKLNKGTDFVVKYANNKERGIAKVAIIGKGCFKGKIVKEFRIV